MAQDKKFSIIVPLYKDGYKTLDKAILCLKEQDYKNWELIFVHNSPDNKAKKFLKSKDSPVKGLKFTEIDAGYDPELKNGNHCRAFNKGAEVATGDYLIFADPDIYLLPGVLRDYKNAFEESDADFVYGDYDFENGGGRIYGRPFNEYELRCANYVSGAYPVKKEVFKGWDETVQSLQDWDMWLSVIDAGGKGKYIGIPCFTTTPPTSDGISSDQHNNWTERYTYVRTKHGFPPSKTVVTSGGAPLHATKVAEVLGVDSRVRNTMPNLKPHNYQNIYLLGFYPENWLGHMMIFHELGDAKKGVVGKRRIIHWIGTDIFQMQHSLSWTAWKNISMILNDPEFDFIHLAEAEFTADELAELGIDADVVPLPTSKVHPICPLPEEFTIGVYENPTQDKKWGDMYFIDFMEEIAKAMPDVKFKFFGDRNRTDHVDNVEHVGWVEMEDFLPTISAMVRLTKHDGLPISPIEAMQAGRNVLASVPMKHALQAKYEGGEPVKEDIIEKIRQLQNMPLNVEGSKYWSKELSPELFRKRMKKYLV